MRRARVLSWSWLCLFAFLSFSGVALARAKSTTRFPTTLRAEADSKSTALAEVAGGESVEVLAAKGAWSQILTAGGKKGWVQTKVLRDAPSQPSLGAAAAVEAAEGTTAIAIRECPVRRAVILATGGLSKEVAIAIGDGLARSKTVSVLVVRDDVKADLDAAVKLGETQNADIVVELANGEGNSIAYQVIGVKAKKALLEAKTAGTLDPKQRPVGEAVGMMLFALEKTSHDTHHEPHPH